MSNLIKVLKPEQDFQVANSRIKNIGKHKCKLMITGEDRVEYGVNSVNASREDAEDLRMHSQHLLDEIYGVKK